MFQSFAVIGTALTFVGIVYTFIFVRLILKNFKNNETLQSLSESLVTVFIGIFYLYSAMILANNRPENPATNFTNTIDDIVTRNDTFETYYQAISVENPTTAESKPESDPTEEGITPVSEDTNFPNDVEEVKESLPGVSKTDQFLVNYQKFIQTMMKEKMANSSTSNQTFVVMTNPPSKSRTRRDIKLEGETSGCYYEFFLQNALLLYSFMHCLITLLNKTLYCKNCITMHEALESKAHSTKPGDQKIEQDSNSESNDSSAPVGPLFANEEPTTTVDGPNLKLFEAKIVKSQSNSRTQMKQPVKQATTADEKVEKPQKYKFILEIFFMWTLPVVCVIILYCITKLEPVENFGYDVNFLNAINFTSTQSDPNLANLVKSPENFSQANATEVDQIISNVYDIVNQVRENVSKKTTNFTPMMIDIVYFIKPNQRHPKEVENSCPKIDTSVKLFYFFIFIAAYFGVILYAKIIQTSAESKQIDNAQHQKNSLLSFSILWLPSVLELFFRAYVNESKSNILTDLFLALGNTNRIYTMASNHLQSKKYLNKPNFVNPLV